MFIVGKDREALERVQLVEKTHLGRVILNSVRDDASDAWKLSVTYPATGVDPVEIEIEGTWPQLNSVTALERWLDNDDNQDVFAKAVRQGKKIRYAYRSTEFGRSQPSGTGYDEGDEEKATS